MKREIFLNELVPWSCLERRKEKGKFTILKLYLLKTLIKTFEKKK